MDTLFKLLLTIVFSIFVAASSEQKSKKEYPIKAGNLLLDYNWPRLKTGLTRFPHPSSCHHFYSPDSEGQFKLRKCPSGLMFDFVTLKCGRETLSQCWSSQFDNGYKPLHHRKHFHCPLPWGRYPDILNCKKFFQCHGKKVLYKTCPDSTLFDKTKGRCVAETLAICSDAAEIEKYYKCPRSRGLFQYSKDCSKFHECRKRISKLRSCKLNYLFDVKSRKCRPKEEVICGHRYNPYDELTTSDLNDQNDTTTQELQTSKPDIFLNETTENTNLNTSELITAFTKNFDNDSLESFENSSEELSESTENIITDDISQEINFVKTDSDISSSSKQLLMTTHKSSSTGAVETTHDSSSQHFSIITAEIHKSSSDDISTRATISALESLFQVSTSKIAETAQESSFQDLSTGTVEADPESSSQYFSTEKTNAAHMSSSQVFPTGTVKADPKSSSQDFSIGTPETAPASSFLDLSTKGAHERSSQTISTGTVKTARKSSSQDFSMGTVEKEPESSSLESSTKTIEPTHVSLSQEFLTITDKMVHDNSSQIFPTGTAEIVN